ncbi:MAG: hypothetical protein B6D64_02245 [Bacteroidetes bacterium 4484_276]|nr:MAG: hypothetical protein B6D64_02245 [Bacteroidetes bacterium 4484_276]
MTKHFVYSKRLPVLSSHVPPPSDEGGIHQMNRHSPARDRLLEVAEIPVHLAGMFPLALKMTS